jgi:hypothetical protein
MRGRRAIVGGLAALLLAACGANGGEPASVPRPSTSWRDIDAARFVLPAEGPRQNPLVVPIGAGRVVMLGGDVPGGARAAPGGSIWTTADRTWRDLELPFSAPLVNPGAVWTGDQLVLVGTPCADDYPDSDTGPLCIGSEVEVATYTPATGRWTGPAQVGLIGPNENGWPPGLVGLGWTGRHALFQVSDVGGDRYVLRDVTADSWSEVPEYRDSREDTVCVVDRGIFVVNEGDNGLGEPAAGSVPGVIATARYDLARERWQPLHDTPNPAAGRRNTAVACSSGALIASSPGTPDRPLARVLWFDPHSESWETLPEVPGFTVAPVPARVEGARVLFPGWPMTEYLVLEDGASAWGGTEAPRDGEYDVTSDGERVFLQGWDDPVLVLDPVRDVRRNLRPGVDRGELVFDTDT